MPGSNSTITLPILGMSCAACQHHVEDALKKTPGVANARVDLMAHRATVDYDNSTTSPQQLISAVRSSGYDAVLPRTDATAPPTSSEKNINIRTITALVAGFAVMLLSMPLGEMGWADHQLMRILPALYAIPATPLRWTLLLLTLFITIWAGKAIYLAAIRALLHGTTNMNTLVSLGTSVALIYSAYSTIFPAPGRAVYFDAVLLILGFLLAG